MRALFPHINPNQTFYLETGDGHKLYVEESGNSAGIPVVYCHGGPGGGSSPLYRRFYDPEVYRIILFDQRGCGLSTPHCADDINATWNNETSNLVNDMELIRNHLDISAWVVAGGSWGTTLALMYAIEFPERVIGLILRGIFLARQQDINWLFAKDGGASQLFPEYYRQFAEGHPNESAIELLDSYHEMLMGENDIQQLTAAKQFCQWESRIAQLHASELANDDAMSNKEAIAMALLNCHYFTHNSFLYESEILSEIDRIADIPGFIIHGRYDVVCKPEGAHILSEVWSKGALEFVPSAGHSCMEDGIRDALLRASEDMASFLSQK